MDIVVAEDDPRRHDVLELLEHHLAFANEVTPVAMVHALPADALVHHDVTFFAARRNGELLGVGALRRLDASHAELKSMHVRAAARGQGVGRVLVSHLLAVAAERGFRRVSLETGAGDAFAPARALYAATGFVPCEPFGEYVNGPFNRCMTVEL